MAKAKEEEEAQQGEASQDRVVVSLDEWVERSASLAFIDPKCNCSGSPAPLHTLSFLESPLTVACTVCSRHIQISKLNKVQKTKKKKKRYQRRLRRRKRQQSWPSSRSKVNRQSQSQIAGRRTHHIHTHTLQIPHSLCVCLWLRLSLLLLRLQCKPVCVCVANSAATRHLSKSHHHNDDNNDDPCAHTSHHSTYIRKSFKDSDNLNWNACDKSLANLKKYSN